jgi:hypothetical protein
VANDALIVQEEQEALADIIKDGNWWGDVIGAVGHREHTPTRDRSSHVGCSPRQVDKLTRER